MTELTRTIRHAQDLSAAMAWATSVISRNLHKGEIEIALRAAGKRRSNDQNRKMWPMLSDIAKQVQWPVNGQLAFLTPDDWKDILSAGLDSEQRVTPGINGGFVMLGKRTSRMKKAEFCELIELIHAFGSQHGVQWSEPALVVYDEYKEARK